MILHEYRNGNCSVTIHGDGTKTRMWDGEAKPILPESIDLKITDYCDMGCPFCHEKSTTFGLHADYGQIENLIGELVPGMELALGGGNPLDYPSLDRLLSHCSDRQLIPNLTVHHDHVIKHGRRLAALQRAGYVYGLGISLSKSAATAQILPQILDGLLWDNVVYHAIAGITSVQSVIKARDIKILVLGYKEFGFGVAHLGKHTQEIENGLSEWRYWLPRLIEHSKSVSFDNLALEQLGVRDIVEPEVFERHYMGDDGAFTMYIDAVRKEYAKSSTSERKPIAGKSIREMFQDVRASAMAETVDAGHT